MEQGSSFRKSSYSGAGASGSCVEVGNGIMVRDTTQDGREDRVTLPVGPVEWNAFVSRVKDGTLPL